MHGEQCFQRKYGGIEAGKFKAMDIFAIEFSKIVGFVSSMSG